MRKVWRIPGGEGHSLSVHVGKQAVETAKAFIQQLETKVGRQKPSCFSSDIAESPLGNAAHSGGTSSHPVNPSWECPPRAAQRTVLVQSLSYQVDNGRPLTIAKVNK